MTASQRLELIVFIATLVAGGFAMGVTYGGSNESVALVSLGLVLCGGIVLCIRDRQRRNAAFRAEKERVQP